MCLMSHCETVRILTFTNNLVPFKGRRTNIVPVTTYIIYDMLVTASTILGNPGEKRGKEAGAELIQMMCMG